jgi:glycosyltransferase involved in cell wall biosynthesis
MKVTFVSRWGVQCGIATYTDQLALSLVARKDIECECAAEKLKGIPEIPVQAKKVPFTRCWSGDQEMYGDLVEHVRRSRPDVLHIQHEFGLMDSPKGMLEMLPRIRALGVPVVVTCHTVMPPPSNKGWFFMNCLSQVARVVAHNDETRQALLDWKLKPASVAVIPHGTLEECAIEDKTPARRKLYLPEDPRVVIAVSLGFITQGKMQHEAVEAIVSLVQDGLLDPQYFLYVIAGKPGQNTPENIEYCRRLHEIVQTNRAWNYIRIVPRFIAVDDLPVWYGASDFVITGSQPTFFSVSGRSHQEMAFGMPSISSRANLLADLSDYRSMKYESIEELRAHILRMAKDGQLRETFARRCVEFADDTSWTNVAAMHFKLYESLKGR